MAKTHCRRCDGAAAEVSATSISFCKPKLAEVCPTSADLTIAFVHSVGLTDALTASLEKCVEVLVRRGFGTIETAQKCRIEAV
jgi:hypothetical protein